MCIKYNMPKKLIIRPKKPKAPPKKKKLIIHQKELDVDALFADLKDDDEPKKKKLIIKPKPKKNLQVKPRGITRADKIRSDPRAPGHRSVPDPVPTSVGYSTMWAPDQGWLVIRLGDGVGDLHLV